jgi:hypothetical protein
MTGLVATQRRLSRCSRQRIPAAGSASSAATKNAAELARKVGRVEIDVPASARVTVDGRPLEETPKDPVPVQPGRHTIEATFDGKVRNVSVECVAGSVVKARIDFDTPGTEPPAEERRPASSARWIVLPCLVSLDSRDSEWESLSARSRRAPKRIPKVFGQRLRRSARHRRSLPARTMMRSVAMPRPQRPSAMSVTSREAPCSSERWQRSSSGRSRRSALLQFRREASGPMQ